MTFPIKRTPVVRVLGLTGLLGAAFALRDWQNTLTRLVDEHARYWRRRAEQPGKRLYVALGDSLAQGISARRPDQGYVGRLAAYLERRSGHAPRVVNLAAEELAGIQREVLAGFPHLVPVRLHRATRRLRPLH